MRGARSGATLHVKKAGAWVSTILVEARLETPFLFTFYEMKINFYLIFLIS
jgi:hypothetical protein